MLKWIEAPSSQRISTTWSQTPHLGLSICLNLLVSLACPCSSLFLKCFYGIPNVKNMSFPGGSAAKNPSVNTGGHSFDPWVRTIPWRKPTPVFLPGKFHGQRSLAGYSPWVAKSWTQLSNQNKNKKSAFLHLLSHLIHSKTCKFSPANFTVTDGETGQTQRG